MDYSRCSRRKMTPFQVYFGTTFCPKKGTLKLGKTFIFNNFISLKKTTWELEKSCQITTTTFNAFFLVKFNIIESEKYRKATPAHWPFNSDVCMSLHVYHRGLYNSAKKGKGGGADQNMGGHYTERNVRLNLDPTDTKFHTETNTGSWWRIWT